MFRYCCHFDFTESATKENKDRTCTKECCSVIHASFCSIISFSIRKFRTQTGVSVTENIEERTIITFPGRCALPEFVGLTQTLRYFQRDITNLSLPAAISNHKNVPF
ncbi:hypothetical protein TNIN_487811 [Trichonephila inaurata madagascariensis]|uniref:Uncharacterized protein n=1 Tax=Trichonephila inaurata madagascariensis TaxID=2747483 RepID=A0A8X6WVK6_9ARAC|nr:hypothetical protein TNIN_487811 [Trichonephila inaurata madagascariensis]